MLNDAEIQSTLQNAVQQRPDDPLPLFALAESSLQAGQPKDHYRWLELARGCSDRIILKWLYLLAGASVFAAALMHVMNWSQAPIQLLIALVGPLVWNILRIARRRAYKTAGTKYYQSLQHKPQ